MKAALQAIVDRFVRGQISAPVTAMELLLQAPDVETVMSALPQLQGDPEKLTELRRLLARQSAGCSSIVTMLRNRSSEPGGAVPPEQSLERVRHLFDKAVEHSEEASVALYSLGNPELLSHATREVVDVLQAWEVLHPSRRVLEIGCGIGRFLVALAQRVRQVVGVDVSPAMVEVAKRRLHEVPNVRVQLTSGRDLAGFADSTFELVYAVDVFPYIVEAGRQLVETHFQEVARVLAQGGDFVILNYAYGRSRAESAAEVHELSQAVGLTVVRSDETPFRLWNGVGYQLRKHTQPSLP